MVAAGASSRFGGPIPKQFESLGGCTVLERSVRALTGADGCRGAVVVISPDVLGRPEADVARSLPGVEQVVGGGASRMESVRHGLERAETSHVLVHDAARPLVSSRLVNSVIQATREHGAAIPTLPVPDTVKRLDGREWIRETLDRSELGLAQTPQGARTSWLIEALDKARQDGIEVTDESSALEYAGRRVAQVPGDPANLKITTSEDLQRARRELVGGAPGLRVGTGFDIHRVDPERPLVLGGVRFEGEPGLAGHSDADVLLHAAMDALLGAAALGDIGTHFPPGDKKYAGADSAVLAARVADLVGQAGFQTINLDLMLLAERPKIMGRAKEIRARIGECLGLDPACVSLKATTLEGLGSLGRHEGMAAQAVALLWRSDG